MRPARGGAATEPPTGKGPRMERSGWMERPWARVLLPVAFVAMGAALQSRVLTPLGAHTTFVALFLAVVLSAVLGGLLSGALATVLSGLTAMSWLSTEAPRLGEWLALAVFVAGGLAVSWIGEAAGRARKRLARSERLLSETGRVAKVGGWSLDLVANRLEWTEETRRIHGVPEAFVPDVAAAIDFYHPDDRPAIAEAVRRAVEKAEPFDLELRIVTARGNVRWVRARGHALFERSVPVTVLGSFQDVTERHEAEAALRASEAKYRLLAENAAELVSVIGADGVIRYVSPASLTLDGYAPEELVGRSVSALLVVPEDLAVLERAMARHASGEEYVEARFRIRRKDGRVIWVERSTRAIRDAATGGIAEFHAVLRDVTEAVEAETDLKRHRDHLEELVAERTAELREAEQRWQFALEGAGDGIWDWRPPTGEVFYSRRWKEMLGYSDDEVPNRLEEWESRIHPDDRARVLDLVERYFDGRSPEYAFEHRLRCRGGGYRWILSRAVALGRDAAGRPLRVLGVHTDVTARREAEDELRAARDRLASANVELAKAARMKDEFLASLSHEMRTPLTAIVGTAEHLCAQPDGALSPDARRHVESIGTSGRRLQELVDEILDVARLDAGRVRAESERILAADVVAGAARKLRAAAAEKGQELVVAVEPDGLVLSTDAARLAQLLGCLLSNAVKFTPPGGRIEVTASGDEDAGVARISVRDTGIGIAAEDVGRLFSSFVQLDGRTERAYGGVGLGLALVKRLTELLGGTIAVESTPGAGTCFTLTLPWTERAVASAPGAPRTPPSGTRPTPRPAPEAGLARRVPADLRAALHAAVERADAEEIESLAGRLAERDAEAARLVRELAGQFEYESLLRELEPNAG